MIEAKNDHSAQWAMQLHGVAVQLSAVVLLPVRRELSVLFDWIYAIKRLGLLGWLARARFSQD